MTFEELTAITKKTREELADLFLDETASEEKILQKSRELDGYIAQFYLPEHYEKLKALPRRKTGNIEEILI